MMSSLAVVRSSPSLLWRLHARPGGNAKCGAPRGRL